MSDTWKKGDAVRWNSSQGIVHGTIEKKLVSPAQIKGHRVNASKDNPQYLVRSHKTGALAAHKPGALHKD